jgi:hypothetical protein
MADQKIMYALSQGDYSDYRVLAICETKEAAEAAAAKINQLEGRGYYEVGIEEIAVVDESVHRTLVHHISIEILDDGTAGVEFSTERNIWSYDLQEIPAAKWRWVRAPYIQDRGGRLDVHGTDLERVRKVFGEQRAALMADAAYRDRVEMAGG